MIENRTLKPKDKFVAVYHDVKFVLETAANGKNKNGEPAFTFHMIEPKSYNGPKAAASSSLHGGEDGKTYTSLSSAASAIGYPGRWDGWHFWTREKEFTDAMAVKRRGETLKGKTKAKVERKPAKAKQAALPETNGIAPKKVATKAQPKAEGSTKTSKAVKAVKPVAAAPKSNGAKPTAAAPKARAPKAEPVELDI